MKRFPKSDSTCTVYLIHFSRPYRHAQHYIGMCRDGRVEQRLEEHRKGQGARICKQAVEEGIELVLARVWNNVPRYYEQKLKNRGGAAPLCPVCKGDIKLEDCK